MAKKADGPTFRRRAGERASAGVRRAATAVQRARAWARERAPEPIPVSTFRSTPTESSESSDWVASVQETVRRHPLESLLGAVLAGYLVGRLLP